MKNPIPLLRTITLVEAVSFLILLGIAMPLKYIWHMPMAVRITGSVHGALFIAFCFALHKAYRIARWPVQRVALRLRRRKRLHGVGSTVSLSTQTITSALTRMRTAPPLHCGARAIR